jgi:ABC-type glycerol-3-phosphate transport system permease component
MQKKTITNIKSASLFILLLIGAFLVLLPMIWMVITAVKQPGQGLKFNFFPKTIVMTDKFIPDSKPTLIIEIKKVK